MVTPAPIVRPAGQPPARFGRLDWRILDGEGVVLREWSSDVLRCWSTLDAEVAALRRSAARQRAVVYVRDPDGDLWPEHYWKRVLTLEGP